MQSAVQPEGTVNVEAGGFEGDGQLPLSDSAVKVAVVVSPSHLTPVTTALAWLDGRQLFCASHPCSVASKPRSSSMLFL